MNIINSDEWEKLAYCIKKEDDNTINYIFDFLADETAKYEVGEAAYPSIDFAIAIALDRKNEERRNRERLAMEKPVLNLKPDAAQNKPTEKEEKEPTTPELSPKTKREKVRNSWLNRFEEKMLIQPEPEPEPSESITKTVARRPIIRRRIVKKETEPEPEH